MMLHETSPHPKITVVIAAYNMSQYIQATLTNLQTQNFSEFEVIVVDDGSTDNTGELVKQCKATNVRLIFQNNAGVSAARNRGLENVRTPYVVFLDGDDLLHPKALSAYVHAMSKYDIVACYGNHKKFYENNLPIIEDNNCLNPSVHVVENALHKLLKRNFIVNGGALCINTQVARDAGGYNKILRLGEDWEFWCRILLFGKLGRLENCTPLYYRIRSDGCNRKWRMSKQPQIMDAVNCTYSNPVIRDRIGVIATFFLRRLALANEHWITTRFLLLEKNYFAFLWQTLIGALTYPETVLNARKIIRFFMK